MRILLVEDDKIISDLLKKGLSEAGYNVAHCGEGDTALEMATNEAFDLIIMDIMIPGRDGIAVVEELRRRRKNMPVLFLSAKRSVEEKIEGLQRGGDDYLTKPFSFSELLVRCQVLLRRSGQQVESHRLTYEDLEIDFLSRTVKRDSRPLSLQQKEFALLEFLIRNQGRVLTKTQILETVWNYDFDPQTNVVDVLVCRLRNKVDKGFSKKLIKTIRGVGYALKID